jgi:hypothetical protein
MEHLLQAKISEISSKCSPTVTPYYPSSRIADVVLNLLDLLKMATFVKGSGSETQKSASNTEKPVFEMIDIPELKKTKSKKRGLYEFGPFVDECYGFSRCVEKVGTLRFTMPESSGVYKVYQPFGAAANPDILLVDIIDGKIVSYYGIEVKSGDTEIVWNTHIQFSERKLLYVAIQKSQVNYMFGDMMRTREDTILALAHDELLRELVGVSNSYYRSKKLPHYSVSYPKHEIHRNFAVDRDSRHDEVTKWFQSFVAPSDSQTLTEPHSPLA